MTKRLDAALTTLAGTVSNETVASANTHARIGGLLGDLVDSKVSATAPATNGQVMVSRSSSWHLAGAVQGADLTDASVTLHVSGGNEYWMPTATMSAGRGVTCGVGGVDATYGGDYLAINREDATANTLSVYDDAGTPLYVFPVSKQRSALLMYDKDLTHFVYIGSTAMANG